MKLNFHAVLVSLAVLAAAPAHGQRASGCQDPSESQQRQLYEALRHWSDLHGNRTSDGVRHLPESLHNMISSTYGAEVAVDLSTVLYGPSEGIGGRPEAQRIAEVTEIFARHWGMPLAVRRHVRTHTRRMNRAARGTPDEPTSPTALVRESGAAAEAVRLALYPIMSFQNCLGRNGSRTYGRLRDEARARPAREAAEAARLREALEPHADPLDDLMPAKSPHGSGAGE